jgi:hypothetical protein
VSHLIARGDTLKTRNIFVQGAMEIPRENFNVMKVDWNKYRIPISAKVERYLQPDYISELIGTFYLVFTVCVNVLQSKTLAPLSIGAILMSFIFATGG